MADTKRKQIVDAFNTAIGAITGMGKVTQDMVTWAEANLEDFPLAFVDAQKPEVMRLAYPHPTADDMEAEMLVTLNYQTMSEFGTGKRGDVDALMQDIEQAVVGSAALAALIKDVWLIEDEIDVGSEETRGFGAMLFNIRYHYNHNTP